LGQCGGSMEGAVGVVSRRVAVGVISGGGGQWGVSGGGQWGGAVEVTLVHTGEQMVASVAASGSSSTVSSGRQPPLRFGSP
jgi:hypothetical protein